MAFFKAPLVLLVALVLLEFGITNGAILPHTPPDLKPGNQTVEMFLFNLADRDVGFTLAETGTKLSEVVAKPKNWTYLGPATFDLTVDPLLHLNVTVKDNQDTAVTKPMIIDMLQTALAKVKGKGAVILTAVGDAKAKLLSVKVGYGSVLLEIDL
jgi:hypothetical protein